MGIFTGGQQSVGLADFPDEGVVLGTGLSTELTGQNKNAPYGANTGMNSAVGDSDLTALNGGRLTYDACEISFDFTCALTDCPLEFKYVFGSEEYLLEEYNDIFAWFLNGENIALIPGTTTKVSSGTINKNTNSEFYIENSPNGGPYPGFEANGFTTTLTASGNARPGTNTMKLVIADGGDAGVDSWVLLEKDSFVTPTSVPPTTTTSTFPTPGTLEPATNCKKGCMGNDKKVAVCHRASNKHYVSICISENALDTHLTIHGDTCGCCNPDIELNHKKWCDDLENDTNDIFV